MKSLRSRLVLALLAVSFAGVIGVAVASYLALRDNLNDRLDQQVISAVEPATERLRAGGTPPAQDGRRDEPGGERGRGDRDPRDGPGRGGRAEGGDLEPTGDPALPPDTYAELRAPDGTVRSELAIGFDRIDPPDLPADPGLSRPDRTEVFALSPERGPGFRAVAVPQPDGDLVVVALSADEVEDTLERLLRIEMIVAGSALAAILLLSLWLVQAGLAPLREMEEKAEAIAAGDLSQRIDDPDPKTEVGRLALALNEMLRQIETALEEARSSEANLRRFLADASHELRTPLSSVKGYSELFRLGAATDEQALATAMSRIEAEADRMAELVEGMMILAREDERSEAPTELIDLNRLVEDAVQDLQAAHPEQAVTVSAPDGGVQVPAHEAGLRQILANLLQNAHHHGGQTPIKINLDDRVALSVRDHGPGIPEGTEEKVFERLWRADESRSTPGSGLGLAIVAALVDDHGGSVSARNAADGGAIFEVVLPAAGGSGTV